MKIAVELPDDIAKRLEGKWGALSQAALEAIAIEGYRSGALSLRKGIRDLQNLVRAFRRRPLNTAC